MNDPNFSIKSLRDEEIHRFFDWRKEPDNFELLCDLKETVGGFQAGTIWVYVATIGEEWVGNVRLQRFHYDTAMADGEKRGYLGDLQVEAAFRRRGIGRALTEKVLDEALTRGMNEVTLHVDPRNEAAYDLYRAMGFEKFATGLIAWQGEEVEADCLMLSLRASREE